MFIYDEIYGEFEVDKVLEELILSRPVQRLKEIHQGGASYLVNEKWNVTRFDHSIGTMLTTKQRLNLAETVILIKLGSWEYKIL